MKKCRIDRKTRRVYNNGSKRELKTNSFIRLLCALLATIMGVAGVISFLVGQSSANGLVLCVSAIVLMSMALGYTQLELVCRALKMRLKR
jgi:hypothetical protein